MTPTRLLTAYLTILLLSGDAFAQTVAVNGQAPPNAVTVGAATGVAIAVADGPGNTTDWIALYPVGAANDGYLSWNYLSGTGAPPASGLTSTTLNTYAPLTPGDYEWRLFANNGWSRIATSGVVTVTASTAALAVNGVTPPGVASVGAGGSVTVSLVNGPDNATDWIGLAPAGSPNNTLVDWRYLNGTTVAPAAGLTNATVQFLAPATPGSYEIRLFAHGAYGRVATSAITVSASTAALTVNDTAPPTAVSVNPGTYVSVGVTGGPSQPGDWVGLYAASATDSTILAWKYLNGSTTIPTSGQSDATLTFAVPIAAGGYEFRFFNANTFTRLATSTTMVVSASSAMLSVNGVAAPGSATAAAGSQAVVSVAGGPANVGDWVGLYLAGESDSALLDWRYLNDTAQLPAGGVSTATLHFGVPTTPATYELRFFADGGYGRLATSGSIVVPETIAQISVNGIAAPTSVSVEPGSTLTIGITGGPANPTDWVALAPAGSTDSTYSAWQYLNGSSAPPAEGLAAATLSFVLPATAGTYEVRLFAHNGYQRITTSAPIVASSEPAYVSVVMTSPFPGTTFNAPSSLLVTASAWISGGSISRVDFYADETLIGTASAEPFEANWSSPPAGTHQLTAVVVDSTNASTTSPALAVTIGPPGSDLGTLGAPIAEPPSGVYGPWLSVWLTAAPEATIRYTTDGSAPTESSPVFEASLSISVQATIRARAYQAGWTPSEVTTETYTIEGGPPQITAFTPAAGAMGVRSTPITATFSTTMNETSFSETTVRLETLTGAVVSTTRAYDAVIRTITLTPTTPPLPLTEYRVVVVGGPSGVASVTDDTLASTATWTLTTAAANGLGAFWSFEEGFGTAIADGTGNGNTGSLLDGPAWTAGRFGGGLSFDGVDDRVRVPHSETLNFTTSMSMAAWIKLAAQPVGQAVLSKEAPDTVSYELSFDANSLLHGYLRFPDGMHWVSLSAPLPLDQWIHVAVTYDGSLIKLYIDGIESSIEGASGSLLTSSLPLWIGGDGLGNSFPGVVDEVRVYDRALSVSQIAALTTDPPVISVVLTSPFSGTTFNAPASLLVAASASANGGTIGRVDFFSGADLIGSASTPPYETNWLNPPQAVHTLTAVAVDSIDGATTSEPITVTIGPAGDGEGTLATPIASPPGGQFAETPEVTLAAEPTAMIRYTLDGVEPTMLSNLYAGPIVMPSAGATLKARAFKTGWAASEILSADYEIDSTPPYLMVTSPAPRVLVSAGSLTIQGIVLEQISTATVTCDATAATVVGEAFSCQVMVPGGTSTVNIIATDLTGNSRTLALHLTTSNQIGAEPTAIRMTPQNVTLGVGATRRFRAIDNLGRVPSDAEWTIDNETLATLSTTNGVELTAVAAGDVTLTATWHGQSAISTISIMTAVAANTPGTTLWSNPPLLGGGAVNDIVRGATGPDGRRLLYAVEREEEASVLRAFDPDGQEIWAQNLAGRIDQLSGDPLGGAVVLLSSASGRKLQTFAPDGNGASLAVDSPGFAIHPDGPLYVVVGQQLKGIDIGLGKGRTVDLPTGTADTIAGVPTVLSDGSVTLPLRVSGGAHSPGESLDLLWLRPNGDVDVYPVDRDPTGFFHSFNVRPYKAIPNGLGGVLVAYDIHYYHGFSYDDVRVRLVNADGSLGGGSSWGGTNQFSTWLPGASRAGGRFVLGEDRVRATSYRFGSQGTQVRVSEITLDGYGMTDFYLQGSAQPRFTALEGGAFFESYADGTTYGPESDHSAVALSRAILDKPEVFVGFANGSPTARVGAWSKVADTDWPLEQGTAAAPNAALQVCGLCFNGYVPPGGKGPIAPPMDPRQIVTIAIDDSWATSGVYNSKVVDAVTCAVKAWNDATDANGRKTAFFWIVDYEQQRGTADLLVVKNDALCGAGTRACIPEIPGVPFPDMSPPQLMKFHSDNVTNPTITAKDNCGRIAHEMAHKLGGHGSGACGRSIMRGVNSNGTRPVNDVFAVDVMLVNKALKTPQQCTGVQNDGFLTEHLEPSLFGGSNPTQRSNPTSLVPLATKLRRPDPFAAMVAASDPLARFTGVTECRGSSK